MTETLTQDLRLIEAGFPCHQVGAETQRERGASSALPPVYYLHVWWARRPLTPSRAAILGAILSADCDVGEFLRALGIAKPVAQLPDGSQWVLVNPTMLKRISWADDGRSGKLAIDTTVRNHFAKEVDRRAHKRTELTALQAAHPALEKNAVLIRWIDDNTPLDDQVLDGKSELAVSLELADPACVQDRIALAKSDVVKASHGGTLNIDKEDLYGYDRAFKSDPPAASEQLTVLDPTAGGGSIPFEALRLGHNVIANDLNPVATIIQYATLDYPKRFGSSLLTDIEAWGGKLIDYVAERMEPVTPFCALPPAEIAALEQHLADHPKLVASFSGPEYDQQGLIYCREVSCPHCGGRVPLLNSFWLSKEGDRWAVLLTVESNSSVSIEPYRLHGAPDKETAAKLDAGTVTDGKGLCVHCQQVIDGDEIKAQGRGESIHGKMVDRLFCVAAVRFQPKRKKSGQLDRYASGERKGELKTQKVRFFRAPIERDLAAIEESAVQLEARWDEFDKLGLIPTEDIPPGHKTGEEGGEGSGTDKPLKLGTTKWHQLFTPRQLLGHLTLMAGLKELIPLILEELGEDRGRAVTTYLQFAIDKGLDYNSRQTRWHYSRGVINNTFARHDFSFKWTFGEMVFAGPHSGARWTLSQVCDAYQGMSELMEAAPEGAAVTILSGSGSAMNSVADSSVDVVVNDPPYYNNVMYAELADFFYVWMKRSLADLYPGLLESYLTDKVSEAVANPHRDGTAADAAAEYEQRMREMYAECHRVTKADGRMVLMFTHKSQEGWETLTRALIDSGWTITATYPVDSEAGHSMHIRDNASAESSIFIVCNKRSSDSATPGLWKAFGGQGVQQRIIEAVAAGLGQFEALDLRPVDTMVASYGRALRVLSEKWPVLDGDEPVSPIRAMNEASRVVAEHHIRKLTDGRLKVEDLTPEAAMALTLYGICGLQQIRFDEVLNVSRSLGIALNSESGGYDATLKSIGYATQASGKATYHAPLIKRNANLRLARPEERNPKRISAPQHEWDVMQGMIAAYRKGDVPVARAYLTQHAEGSQARIIDLLRVWTNEAEDDEQRTEGEALLFGMGE
ncbi:MAG: DUF1156 domain-containing protein [Armatimonadetes bacterium]|nr:MAG: DUF1156 domain-containing protein [Armatimonadota bacterium]